MSEHADFINGLHVVAYELQRVIGELDGMQDRLGISGLDRVSLDPLQWALSKLADDLHDASAELRDARLDVVLARGDASEARATQKNEQLQSLSVFNELRHELETVKAERDSLKQQRDDLDKSFVQSMQPTMASVVQLVEAAKATAVEVTKKAEELPPEPAPESYEWQVGDEVKRDDGTIHTISQAIGGLLWFKDQTIGMSEQWWLAENGYQLHRKASDIQQPPSRTNGRWGTRLNATASRGGK
jgi:chemotaxis protein histidine kinase CheA